MTGFFDRRLIKPEKSIAEMEMMDRQITEYAAQYGLAGDNIPRVIGASDTNAWVDSQYLVAWGCELDSWRKSEPRNHTIQYISQADPLGLGSLKSFALLEGDKITGYYLECIALTVGRHREMVQIGIEPKTNPIWSFAGTSFTKAVILNEVEKHGRFDLNSKYIKMSGPVARLSFTAPWTEMNNADLNKNPENGQIIIAGTMHLPQSLMMNLAKFEGQPLSSLISGKAFESMTIKKIEIEPYFMDDEDSEVSMAIIINGSMERLGNPPESIKAGNPIEIWLSLGRG